MEERTYHVAEAEGQHLLRGVQGHTSRCEPRGSFRKRDPYRITSTKTVHIEKYRTEGLRDGDIPDNRDQWHYQDASSQVRGHIEEVLGLIADRPPKRRWLDARETGVDVTRENERRTAARLEDVGRDRAEDDHERVPGRTNRPEEPL